MNPEISLILTADRRTYLAEALMSIAAQDDRDFEFLLCIDTKKDPLLPEYCEYLYSQIQCTVKRMISASGNGTAGWIRNYAFQHTHGQWISYLDGDDMLSPNAISTMRNAIVQYPGVGIFSSAMMRITTEGVVVPLAESLDYYPPIKIYSVDPEVVGEPTYFNQFQMMRRTVWEDYPYDCSSNGEDIDFMLIQLLRTKFKKIPEYLYYYRDVPNSFSKIEYQRGDFTTQRYQSGFYVQYQKENYNEVFYENFREGHQ